MTTVLDERPCPTSAYTYLDQSPFAPADKATRLPSPLTDAQAEAWDEVFNQLIDIGRLQEDWDGEGSVAPDRGVVAAATMLAFMMKRKEEQPPDRVLASVNGTIYFEWYPPDGYLDIEVMSPVDAERRWIAHGATVAEVTPFAIP